MIPTLPVAVTTSSSLSLMLASSSVNASHIGLMLKREDIINVLKP